MTIGSGTAADVEERVAAIETALCGLDLETKVSLMAGIDSWSLPGVPSIGLAACTSSVLVMRRIGRRVPFGLGTASWAAGECSADHAVSRRNTT